MFPEAGAAPLAYASSLAFVPTRAAALARLDAFAPNMGSLYAKNRNRDDGPADRRYVSCLSPYLRHRLITEQEVIAAALNRFAFSTAEKFIQEVYWRTYFKGWLERRPWVWDLYTDDRDRRLNELSGDQATAYQAAVEGRTGIDGFDAWTKELIATGYLHNHARMWFASIWIFTLRLPWSLGADFFHRHLLDGDAASNTLSWRWVGGLHTKGKTYLARPSNIEKFTNGRFSPSPEDLAKEAPALEDDWNGEPGDPPGDLPLTSRDPAFLLLHEEDLGLETLPVEKARLVGVGLFVDPACRSAAPVGGLVSQFTQGAIDDTRHRAKTVVGCDAVIVPDEDNLLEAVTAAGANTVILPYLPVGPLRGPVARMTGRLAAEGFRVETMLRSHDRHAWPHASKGFFRLKKKIPSLIARERTPSLL